MAHRPTFFLSSTIHDFRDLRSAIKFSLEQRGCLVLASEFNDFGGSLDLHSYEACLSNIERADFFVLLIGSRVGGWYDSKKRISITQQEYRKAYEMHRSGRLRLVSFVRDEVWQMRDDRRELERHLADTTLTESDRAIVRAAPSRHADDAEFVSGFIREVGRNVETGRAVGSGKTKPTGNWLHRFRDFRDIHDVLHPLAFTGLTSDEAAYRKALENELLLCASRLFEKSEGQVIDPRRTLRECMATNPIRVADRDEGVVVVDLEVWNRFATVCMFASIRSGFRPNVITDALTSTIFLDYDRENGVYVQTDAYDALSKLCGELRQFEELATADNLSIFYRTTPSALGRSTGSIELDAMEVAVVYALAHRWINILDLCLALVAHVRGGEFAAPQLMPFSPIEGLEEAIRGTQVSVSDLREVLGI